jgi:hypothetical protein
MPDERLKWNMKMLVEGYDNVGSKNPKWDDTAKEILTEFARIRAGSDYELETRFELLGDRTTEALKAGCDDPLIKYLHCRYGMSNAKLSDWQTQFKSSAKSLENSAYAPLLKFYGDIRASNALWQNRKTNLWNDVHELRMDAIGLLSAALEDKTMPIEEVSQACQLMIESASSKYQLTNAYFAIEKPLFKNWPHASVSYFIKGRFYYEFAWRQRGGGYADSISSNAWASFAANLAIAEKAYQKAWSLNPKDVRIPVQMIEMTVSQQKKRPEMELWFQRAMQLNTNNYEACLKKLRYLNPKWYGTREDMIGFGRQCVASTNWGGRVPYDIGRSSLPTRRIFSPRPARSLLANPGRLARHSIRLRKNFPIESRSQKFSRLLRQLRFQMRTMGGISKPNKTPSEK